MMEQNPELTEEELVVACWAYKFREPASLSENDPTIRRLSEVLRSLPIHPENERLASFRSPEGIRRRLGDVQTIDVGGEVSGRERYKQVIENYRNRPIELDRRAREILGGYGVSWD